MIKNNHRLSRLGMTHPEMRQSKMVDKLSNEFYQLAFDTGFVVCITTRTDMRKSISLDQE